MIAAPAASVLVVDDDRTVCDLIRNILESRGYATALACNGKEALAYLKKSPRAPRLILLDLMMPEMNGWEFQRAQQQDPAICGIPVAIITGLPELDGKARDMGAVDVLCKPSKVEPLVALVSRFCDKA
jgi:CheY-like chemotaxis protein